MVRRGLTADPGQDARRLHDHDRAGAVVGGAVCRPPSCRGARRPSRSRRRVGAGDLGQDVVGVVVRVLEVHAVLHLHAAPRRPWPGARACGSPPPPARPPAASACALPGSCSPRRAPGARRCATWSRAHARLPRPGKRRAARGSGSARCASCAARDPRPAARSGRAWRCRRPTAARTWARCRPSPPPGSWRARSCPTACPSTARSPCRWPSVPRRSAALSTPSVGGVQATGMPLRSRGRGAIMRMCAASIHQPRPKSKPSVWTFRSPQACKRSAVQCSARRMAGELVMRPPI